MISFLKEKFLNRQFITFAIIGVINTLDSLLFYDWFQNVAAVALASILADVVSMIGSYFMNTYFTYHQKPSIATAVKFPVSYIPGTIISAVITWIVADILHLPRRLAKAISLPITFPINYLVMTYIFKDKTS